MHLISRNNVPDLFRLKSDEMKVGRPDPRNRDAHGSSATNKAMQLNESIPNDLPAVAYSEAKPIWQIRTNLISNTIRFRQTGSIDVSVTITEQSNDRIRLPLHVSDAGVRIL